MRLAELWLHGDLVVWCRSSPYKQNCASWLCDFSFFLRSVLLRVLYSVFYGLRVHAGESRTGGQGCPLRRGTPLHFTLRKSPHLMNLLGAHRNPNLDLLRNLLSSIHQATENRGCPVAEEETICCFVRYLKRIAQFFGQHGCSEVVQSQLRQRVSMNTPVVNCIFWFVVFKGLISWEMVWWIYRITSSGVG